MARAAGGLWFFHVAACELFIVCSACVFVSPLAMCFWLGGELFSLCPQGRQKGTQCDASQGPQLATRTYICGRDAPSPTCITIKVSLWASGLPVSDAHDDEVAAYFHTVPPRSLAALKRLLCGSFKQML